MPTLSLLITGDASALASDLTAIDNATSIAIDASAVTNITGTVGDANPLRIIRLIRTW